MNSKIKLGKSVICKIDHGIRFRLSEHTLDYICNKPWAKICNVLSSQLSNQIDTKLSGQIYIDLTNVLKN